MKIKTKIIMIYISIVLISFLVISLFFDRQSQRFVKEQLGRVAMQTMQALNENLDLIFENVTQFSNLIYFDETIQKKLAHNEEEHGTLDVSKDIQKSLIYMLLSGDYISSVEIFDRFDKHYLAYKRGPMSLKVSEASKAPWYEKVQERNGDILFAGGDDPVLYYRTEPEKRLVSLIRTIADIDTYEDLATLIINIDESTFQDHFNKVGKQYHSQFCIIDSQGGYMVKPSVYTEEMDSFVFCNQIGSSGYQMINLNGKRMILTQQELGIEDWKLIGLMPVDNNIYLSDYYSSQLFLVIVINLVFIFVCTLYLTRLIFNPLNKMEEYMHKVEAGSFEIMPLDTDKKDEMEHLKAGFNKMVLAIQRLLLQVKEEERIIRKNELDIIQEQINPHFLYNTLDAISALVLTNDRDNSFLMLRSLGQFYRNSLNSGRDLVKVKDEIDCIKSYITILNIRYGDKIIMEYDIEEKILDRDILKLILQPVIENAVHHGIRNKEGKGTISIKAYEDEGELIFIVTDDGLGMTEERIKEVMEGRNQRDRSGFGLYSAKQRISLFYNMENPITIHSEIGWGTEVTICVRNREEGRMD